ATLMNNKGVCYNYAAVFTVMMRAVGLECFSFEGTSTYADGHWDVHTWNNILINGRWLLFDAQVDDNIYNKLGYMLYDRFGLTASDSTVTENYKYETSDRLQDARYFNYFD
ncbi:MAG: transglutaminase domain-containing protein, partial [Ruminococcus sp.]|nr:transglutaminase domain-containing protein [Ruminococcus sp.]